MTFVFDSKRSARCATCILLLATLGGISCAAEKPLGESDEDDGRVDESAADESPAADPAIDETGTEESSADDEMSSADDASDGPGDEGMPGSCGAVQSEILGRVDLVSTGAVHLEADAPRVLYVDASAGGFQVASSSPYVYVSLAEGARVEVTDVGAETSTDWDLAFKRFTVLTNGGDSGSGLGRAMAVEADFGDVSLERINLSQLQVDDFVDDVTCEPLGDGTAAGPFAIWYDYAEGTMVLTPRPLVFIVQSADGQNWYKLQILDYYASPEGGSGLASARYRLQYEAL